MPEIPTARCLKQENHNEFEDSLSCQVRHSQTKQNNLDRVDIGELKSVHNLNLPQNQKIEK